MACGCGGNMAKKDKNPSTEKNGMKIYPNQTKLPPGWTSDKRAYKYGPKK